MIKTWLNKKGNKKCILFFNGWGMDDRVINQLETRDFDICMFHCYNPLSAIYEDFNEYDFVYLVAWSLGVWVASKLISAQAIKITKAIAINGTENPISKEEGISPADFDSLVQTWDEKSRKRFNMLMFGGAREYVNAIAQQSARSFENQKKELETIRKEILQSKNPILKYNCAIIGKADFIFTHQNQLNYWKSTSRVIELDVPHFPFGEFKSWNQIIAL